MPFSTNIKGTFRCIYVGPYADSRTKLQKERKLLVTFLKDQTQEGDTET